MPAAEDGGDGGVELLSMDTAAWCWRSCGCSFLKYSFRFLGGSVLLSRSAINTESDSGDEDRSGDSGEDRGGVSRFSVPAMAASTCRTMSLDDLSKAKKEVNSKFCKVYPGEKAYLNSVTCEAGAK